MKLFTLIILTVASYAVSAQCGAPTGLSTSSITATAGTATWSPVSGATSYNVEYKPSSSSSWIVFGFGTSGLQWTLSGLDANTSYDWRVKATCTSGTSVYAQTTFTTGSVGSCSVPTGLSTTNITSSTATMNWSPVSGSFSYRVEYKLASATSWLTATSGTNGTSYNLYGLTAGATYDWRVNSNCSLSEASGYSTTRFTTSGGSDGGGTTPPSSPCPGIYDVSTNGTISGAATIGVNTEIKGTVSVKNDIDYYKFTITGTGTITVWLTTLPANYDLAVLNGSGSTLAISQNNGSKNESITLSVSPGDYYAKVFPKGTANNAKSCYTLKVQTVTASGTTATRAGEAATMEAAKQKFAITLFPNPANSQLNVWVDGVDNRPVIKVYDLMGKLVMQQGSSNILTQLNISKLPAGFYMVNVNDGKETKSARFIKQ